MTTESKSAFARRLGVAPSYVTKLTQAGRLIVIDGQIEVESSLTLIEATKDPNRDDVRQRHARARDERRQGRPVVVPSAGEPKRPTKEAPQPAAQPMLKAASAFREAQAERMSYQARIAQMRVARLQGKLASMADIRKIGAAQGAMIRTMLENLPDQIAPRCAPVRDPERIGGILGTLFEGILKAVDAAIARDAALLIKRPNVNVDAD